MLDKHIIIYGKHIVIIQLTITTILTSHLQLSHMMIILSNCHNNHNSTYIKLNITYMSTTINNTNTAHTQQQY